MKASLAARRSTRISANITVVTAPNKSDPIEVEIKLAVLGAAAARSLLRAKGFRVFKPRVFESNDALDTPEQRLRAAGSLLRIRSVKREVTLTFKGPPRNSKHKSREEREVKASDAHTLAAILERLGFQRVFRYQKYRTEFRRGKAGIVTLDETPIGTYLELEGPPEWIDRTARLLGFTEMDYITLSYGQLYLDWCARHGRVPGDMVF
jgi:adenylate cyclase, class 2